MKSSTSVRLSSLAAVAALSLTIISTAHAQQSLYVSNENDDTIAKISGGVTSTFTNTGVNAPAGLAFDSTGNLFLANGLGGSTNGGTIEKFTPGGVASVFASTSLNGPEGLAFDSAGNLYVANINTITKFSSGGIASTFANPLTGSPRGLAFDRAGNLYATTNNTTIEKFTPGGIKSVFATVGLSSPYSLAFDSSGNLYAANNLSNTIEKFTPLSAASVFASTGLDNPQGLAFDSTGNLYAANTTNGPTGSGTIEEFTANGAGTQFASGLNNPTFLAFYSSSLPAAVPEACTTVGLGLLLALGLGGMMVAVKRRKQTEPTS